MDGRPSRRRGWALGGSGAAPGAWSLLRGGHRTMVALLLAGLAPRGSSKPPSGGGVDDEPTASVGPDPGTGPIGMSDLQRLEQLAWLVDNRSEEEERYIAAKLALLSRPTPVATAESVPTMSLPTDELSALERLRASGHLSEAEYETLERRIILRI